MLQNSWDAGWRELKGGRTHARTGCQLSQWTARDGLRRAGGRWREGVLSPHTLRDASGRKAHSYLRLFRYLVTFMRIPDFDNPC